VLADWQLALRDEDCKLFRLSTTDWDETASECATTDTTEFSAINEQVPPKLDNKNANLLLPPNTLNHLQALAYNSLNKQLDNLLASEITCTGDGNTDGVVDFNDISQLGYWANITGSKSSWYDFNLDGFTNEADLPYITQAPFPRSCSLPLIFKDSFET